MKTVDERRAIAQAIVNERSRILTAIANDGEGDEAVARLLRERGVAWVRTQESKPAPYLSVLLRFSDATDVAVSGYVDTLGRWFVHSAPHSATPREVVRVATPLYWSHLQAARKAEE